MNITASTTALESAGEQATDQPVVLPLDSVGATLHLDPRYERQAAMSGGVTPPSTSRSARARGTLRSNAEKAARRANVARWRAKVQRIDYAASQAALAAIDHHLAAGLDTCRVGVIDALVLAGHREISGKRGQP